MTNELQNIISGKKQVKHGTFIQTIANYLSRSQETSLVASNHKHNKNEEEKRFELEKLTFEPLRLCGKKNEINGIKPN